MEQVPVALIDRLLFREAERVVERAPGVRVPRARWRARHGDTRGAIDELRALLVQLERQQGTSGKERVQLEIQARRQLAALYEQSGMWADAASHYEVVAGYVSGLDRRCALEAAYHCWQKAQDSESACRIALLLARHLTGRLEVASDEIAVWYDRAGVPRWNIEEFVKELRFLSDDGRVTRRGIPSCLALWLAAQDHDRRLEGLATHSVWADSSWTNRDLTAAVVAEALGQASGSGWASSALGTRAVTWLLGLGAQRSRQQGEFLMHLLAARCPGVTTDRLERLLRIVDDLGTGIAAEERLRLLEGFLQGKRDQTLALVDTVSQSPLADDPGVWEVLLDEDRQARMILDSRPAVFAVSLAAVTRSGNLSAYPELQRFWRLSISRDPETAAALEDLPNVLRAVADDALGELRPVVWDVLSNPGRGAFADPEVALAVIELGKTGVADIEKWLGVLRRLSVSSLSADGRWRGVLSAWLVHAPRRAVAAGWLERHLLKELHQKFRRIPYLEAGCVAARLALLSGDIESSWDALRRGLETEADYDLETLRERLAYLLPAVFGSLEGGQTLSAQNVFRLLAVLATKAASATMLEEEVARWKRFLSSVLPPGIDGGIVSRYVAESGWPIALRLAIVQVWLETWGGEKEAVRRFLTELEQYSVAQPLPSELLRVLVPHGLRAEWWPQSPGLLLRWAEESLKQAGDQGSSRVVQRVLEAAAGLLDSRLSSHVLDWIATRAEDLSPETLGQALLLVRAELENGSRDSRLLSAAIRLVAHLQRSGDATVLMDLWVELLLRSVEVHRGGGDTSSLNSAVAQWWQVTLALSQRDAVLATCLDGWPEGSIAAVGRELVEAVLAHDRGAVQEARLHIMRCVDRLLENDAVPLDLWHPVLELVVRCIRDRTHQEDDSVDTVLQNPEVRALILKLIEKGSERANRLLNSAICVLMPEDIDELSHAQQHLTLIVGTLIPYLEMEQFCALCSRYPNACYLIIQRVDLSSVRDEAVQRLILGVRAVIRIKSRRNIYSCINFYSTWSEIAKEFAPFWPNPMSAAKVVVRRFGGVYPLEVPEDALTRAFAQLLSVLF